MIDENGQSVKNPNYSKEWGSLRDLLEAILRCCRSRRPNGS